MKYLAFCPGLPLGVLSRRSLENTVTLSASGAYIPYPHCNFIQSAKSHRRSGDGGIFLLPLQPSPTGVTPHPPPPMSSVSANRGKGATTPKEVQVPSGRKSELLKKQISYQVKIDRFRRKKLSKSRRKEKWGWRGGRILCSDETIKNGPIRAM